ncbi:MAG: hypothetical protein JKY50_11925 [Oleispira sp.]|nr:hypothetical protein [Oleispira sp.]MBL4881134.1 hypothetical protein [Oleispira sp.]
MLKALINPSFLKASILICSLFMVFAAQAFELTPEKVNGIYLLAIPERSAAGQTKKLQIEFAEMNGQKVLATQACPRCPAAGYKLQAEVSKELGRPVFFNSMGIYIIAYDDNTFVSVAADGELGKMAWSEISYANIYSKQGTPTISLEVGEQFVVAESQRLMMNEPQRLMTGEGVAKFEVSGGSGRYYAAVSQAVGSKQYDQLMVKLDDKKEIILAGLNCRSCTSSTYVYEAELSQAIAKPVYEMGNMGRFLIAQDKGIIWVVSAPLGKQLWQEHSSYNVLGQDKTAMRQVSQDKAAQDAIEGRLRDYATKAKAEVDARYVEEDLQRTAANVLPAKGMEDSDLELSGLIAARAWANSYSWKEQLQYVYMTSRDWSILRNKLTGIQTGRRIQGVITMKRDDGLCSYQQAIFEQAYNGTDYQEVVMAGVVPGQNKLDCGKI